MGKTSAHGINLPFDGIARDSAFGPTLWHHRTQPNVLGGKQSRPLNILQHALFISELRAFGVKFIAMQCKMLGLRDYAAS